MLLLEVDGVPAAVAEEAAASSSACRDAGRHRSPARATTRPSAQELWRVRREMSLSLKMIAPLKFNHDVVVPKGRIPELFDAGRAARAASSGCASRASATPATATSTSTSWSNPRDADEIGARTSGRARAVRGRRRARGLDQRRARHRLREGAVSPTRAVGGGDRADEAGQARVRSGRDPESGQDFSGRRPTCETRFHRACGPLMRVYQSRVPLYHFSHVHSSPPAA